MHSPTNYRNNKKRKRNDIVDDSQPQSVSAIRNPQISSTANPNNNTTGLELDSSSACGQQPMEYRFVPTDRELISLFLFNMLNNRDLPKNKIWHVDIYQDHPQNIVVNHPQSNEGEWYFFTPRNRRYVNSNKIDRKAGDGYWKAIKSNTEITDDNGTKIGIKNSLIYQGNDQIRTDWMMQEFVVAAHHHHQRQPTLDKSDNKFYDYVLCKIYKKGKRSGGRRQANTNQVVTDQDHHAIVRAPIIPPDQEPRPEQSMITNPLNNNHPSIGGLPRDIVNHHHMRFGQPLGPRVPPPYRPPPPRPHVGLFDDELPNYIVRPSVAFNRSAGPSTSTNQQPLRVAPTPPYRPPPRRPHVGHFFNEPNYIAVPPSAGFSRSAGPSTSTNPQPLSAPSHDYIWDLTELKMMNSQKPKSPR